jgi:Ca2+:H+ antiporter
VAVVLVAIAAGVTRYVHGVPSILVFLIAMFALSGLAWIVSMATEQVGERLSTAATGTLQSTIGNLPEFFVVLFALQAGDRIVAETAILGSILTNALLVLGTVLIAGSLRSKDGIMRFSPRLPNDTATLLLVASFIIALLAVVNVSHDPAARHTQTISIVGAAVILVVYVIWLRQYLTKPDPAVAAVESEEPRLSAVTSLGLLIAGGVGSAFVSDWFVHDLEPTIHRLHISQAFAGLVIVAIAGNAVEHAAGITLAIKGRSDLAIAVVKSSVAQIAAFMYPLLVLVSLLTATHLTFALAPVYVAALIATAILIWQITGDGEATPFEGAALIAVFIAIATVAAFER